MDTHSNTSRFLPSRETLVRISEDLTLLLLFCLLNIYLGSQADPAFASDIGGAILLVLAASAAISIYGAMIGSSRMFSLSVGMLLQIGLTAQALILQDSYIRSEEIIRHALIVVCTVSAALCLIPLFSKLFSAHFDMVVDMLPVSVFLILTLLLYLGSYRGRVAFGSLYIMWPMAIMLVGLPVFSLVLTSPDTTPRQQISRILYFLLIGSIYLFVASAFAQLAVLYLTVITLCCLRLCDRKALLTLLGIVAGLTAGVLLVTWLCSVANHNGTVLPTLLEYCGDCFDKLASRMDVLLHGGREHYEGYQISRVRMALAQSGLLPSTARIAIPVAQNTTTFAALVHRLGLLCGIGVLVIVGCIFVSGLRICKYAASPNASGVGMAFLVYLMVNALVGCGSTLGLLPAIGLDFPLLSASGTSILVSSFMLLYLLHLGRADAQGADACWNAPRRERIAVRCVWGCCLVIAITCGVMILSGRVSAAQEDAPAVETTEPVEQVSSRELVAQILDQTTLLSTDYPVDLSGVNGSFPDTVSHGYLQTCLWRDVNPITAFRSLTGGELFIRQTYADNGYIVTGQFSDPQEPQASFLTDYRSSAGFYPFTDYGARIFLYDVLELSTWFENRLTNSDDLLDVVVPTNDSYYIPFSLSENCFFTYFICEDTENSWVLCFYLYPDENWEYIGSVDFQLLQIAHDRERSEAEQIRHDWGGTVCSLVSAIDYQLHGHSRFTSLYSMEEGDEGAEFNQLCVPGNCCCGEVESSLEYQRYVTLPSDSGEERGQDYIELVLFRLSK